MSHIGSYGGLQGTLWCSVAQWPNTTGVVSAGGGALPSEDTTGNAGMSGDFYLIKNYSSLYLTYTGDASHVNRRRIGFDASRTCSIYSSSPTVQPPAFQALIIIKIWSAAGWTVFKSLNTELELLAFIFTDIEPVALLPLATRSKYPSLMSFEKTPFPCIWYKFWQPGKYPTFSVPVMFGIEPEHNGGYASGRTFWVSKYYPYVWYRSF